MNIQHIDTRHGTANQANFSNGNCQPYTGVPFGMNYFAPQTTDQKGSWWFHPDDHTFQGWVTSAILSSLRSMGYYLRIPCSMHKVRIVQKKAHSVRLI